MGCNRRGYFPFWDTTEKNLRMVNNFFSIVSHNAGHCSSVESYTTTESYAVYCIPEKSSALYPTTPQVFFRCIPQWKIYSSIVEYNGGGFFHCGIQWKMFFLLWDTTERFFSILGYNGRGFFSVVGYNGKKLYNAELYF